jgi:hypothetical protein
LQRHLDVHQSWIIQCDGVTEFLLHQTLDELAPHSVEGRRNFGPHDTCDSRLNALAASHRIAQWLRQLVDSEHEHIIPCRERALRFKLCGAFLATRQWPEVQVSRLPIPRVPADRQILRVLLRQLVRFHLRSTLRCLADRLRRALLHHCFAILELRRSVTPRLILAANAFGCFGQVHQHHRRLLVDAELPTHLTEEPIHGLWLASIPPATEASEQPFTSR